MENGERQRQMDFVLNNLAEVTARVSTLAENQIRTDNSMAALTVNVHSIAGHVQTLAVHVQTVAGQVQILTGQVQALTVQVQGIAVQQAHMNDVVAAIAESQQHTDERLNALIDIVREDRNGQSPA